jgi:hypothetical protein
MEYLLKKHLIVHEPKPYPCVKCKSRFRKNVALLKHRLERHTESDDAKHINKPTYKESPIFQGIQDSFNLPDLKQHMHLEVSILIQKNKNWKLSRAQVDFHLRLKERKVLYQAPLTDILFLVETDQEQHMESRYKTDEQRMSQILHTLRKQNPETCLVFIRFNPDEYAVDDKIVNTPLQFRVAKLVEVMHTFEPSRPEEIIYMYYDTFTAKGLVKWDYVSPCYEEYVNGVKDKCSMICW